MTETTSPFAGRSAGERGLALDRLTDSGPSLEVLEMKGASFGADNECGPRRPHRHDYHELIWSRFGEGDQLIDGETSKVMPGALTVIGRGQVHVFERASHLDGAIVRFGDEMLQSDAAAGASPGWLLGSRGAPTVRVPPGEIGRLEAAIATLASEARRPADPRSLDLQRHFLSALLLWVERWYDASRTQQRGVDDADLQLYRRFVNVLERDFARHHDAAHYATELGVPRSALSRSLSRVTGRGTKVSITDRRMLEAARLLRFSDLTVGEIAFRSGFGDQMYFSRAFRRYYGAAPTAYRDRLRGRVATPTPG